MEVILTQNKLPKVISFIDANRNLMTFSFEKKHKGYSLYKSEKYRNFTFCLISDAKKYILGFRVFLDSNGKTFQRTSYGTMNFIDYLMDKMD